MSLLKQYGRYIDMQNLLTELQNVLEKDQKYLSDGKILKNLVVERSLKLDSELIKLLLSNKEIKEHFFTDVASTLVFDKIKFQEFVSNKQFLPDSYTSFKNKIGLMDHKYYGAKKEVVLAWGYKDCVLEGGQDKEETKRDEIFYNTTLAPDEITRLFDPKVLTKFEYWNEEACKKDKPKAVKEINDRDNILIKGNNLLALHALKKRYAGKVKLIYIDPPYNTNGDSFRYNDSFNHSTWLTFIKNRLEIAKTLLANDGFIFVQINDVEHAYLKVLMDEVFGLEAFQTSICVKMSHLSGVKMAHKDKKIPKIKEHILMYSKNTAPAINPEYVPVSWNDAFERYNSFILKDPKKTDDTNLWEVITLSEALKKFNIDSKNAEASLKFKLENASLIFRTAVNRSADYSKYPKDKISRLQNDSKVWYIYKGEDINFASEKIRDFNGKKLPASIVGDIWDDIAINNLSNEGGITLRFGKKPEMLLKRIISLTTNPEDIVLDFFAGSGTTPAVAHKMGRQWIAIEQMNYIKDLPEARIKNVINGDQTGVSKEVNWKGGGSFIYCEVMEWNEKFIPKVKDAKDTKTLLKIYDDMKQHAFFRYDFDASKFSNKEFEQLSIEDQKKTLNDLMDMNHLYVNLSEIDDKEYNVSEEDKKLNKLFYRK